jgi:hypothetical protein
MALVCLQQPFCFFNGSKYGLLNAAVEQFEYCPFGSKNMTNTSGNTGTLVS